MRDIEITIKLPESLVEEAKTAGIRIEQRMDIFIGAISAEIQRQKAGEALWAIAEKLEALPAEMKPAMEEIETVNREFWAAQ